MEELAQIFQKCSNKNILLLLHHNSDADAVSSAYVLSEGLKQIGAECRIGCAESVSETSQKILKELGFKVEISPVLEEDTIILLDTSTSGQLSELAEKFENSPAEKIIIDHHAVQENGLRVSFKFIDETASSTSIIIYELMKKMRLQIHKNMALATLLGIISDTAHLKFSTLRDFRVISEILENHQIKFSDVLEILTTETDISEKIANLKAAQRIKFHRLSDYLIVTSNVRSYEASAARAFLKLGADVAAVYAKRENEIRISIRAKAAFAEKTGINLAKDLIPEVAKVIKGTGSGHITAAGANGTDVNSGEKALECILSCLRKNIK